MKSILLTTTALVAFAGAAAADGHVTIGWSGTATAGIAREGAVDAVDGAATIAGVLATNPNETRTLAEIEEDLNSDVSPGPNGGLNLATIGAALGTAEVPATAGDPGAAAVSNFVGDDALEALTETLAAATGTAAADAGDFDTYAEVNATVTGSVATDNGLTLTAGMSVDAGTGYDFADDDGFDDEKTNGVGFDFVSIDAGAAGKLTFQPDDLEHLVDDDDDDQADVKYENDFGFASVTVVLDVDRDSDDAPTAQAWSVVNGEPTDGTYLTIAPETAAGAGDGTFLTYTAPVAADVQWSAKVEAPIADIATVYAAFDEEGGYDVGASATVSGVSLSAKAKSEALAVENDEDTEFEVAAGYAFSSFSVGASWNSVDDGDQWGISAGYDDGTIAVAASTDEGEDWEVTASYALNDNASLEAGVNYTEDAFVGVAFNF